MAQLTKEQIAGYAKGAGFSGDDIGIAVAVAMAESGGNTQAHNTTPPDNSYGLWQINMYGNLGPSRRTSLKLKSNDELFDPAVNARAAHTIKQGSGWGAWTTYTSGKYKKHLDESLASKIASGVIGGIGGAIASDTAASVDTSTPLNNVANSINSLGRNLFNTIASGTATAVAGVLVILGIVILMRNQVSPKKILKTVAK